MFNLQGSIVALVTPMDEDGAIDWQALKDLIEWHINSGSSGLVIVGTTGESATLDVAEHVQVIENSVKTANGRIKIIAGTGANSTKEAVYLTNSAKSAGADAALLVTPYYNKPSQEGLYRHYSYIADEVHLPQILYNVPSRTGCDLLTETVLKLVPHDNVVGLKDATGDLGRLEETLSGLTKLKRNDLMSVHNCIDWADKHDYKRYLGIKMDSDKEYESSSTNEDYWKDFINQDYTWYWIVLDWASYKEMQQVENDLLKRYDAGSKKSKIWHNWNSN